MSPRRRVTSCASIGFPRVSGDEPAAGFALAIL